MSVSKKILLGIVTIVIWFILCAITSTMGNDIVFGIIFFSVPIVSIVLLVIGTIKFFKFMKEQEFAETRKIKRELKTLIEKRNQKIQGIINHTYNHDLYPIIDSIAFDNGEIRKLTNTDNFINFSKRYEKFDFKLFCDMQKYREECRRLGREKIRKRDFYFYADKKLREYCSDIIHHIGKYIESNFISFRTDSTFLSQIAFLCYFEEKMEFPEDLKRDRRGFFLETYCKLCAYISSYISGIENPIKLQSDVEFLELSKSIEYFWKELFLYSDIDIGFQIQPSNESCYILFYPQLLETILEKIRKQEAVQEWTNLLKFIENKLYIPDTFILKTKYSIFNDYYNKMLKADYLSSELEYMLLAIFKTFNLSENVCKEEIRVISDFKNQRDLKSGTLTPISIKPPFGLNKNESIFYFEPNAKLLQTRTGTQFEYEPFGEGEDCQVYLTNQRFIIFKSPISSRNLNTIIGTAVQDNQYFIFSVTDRKWPLCLEVLQPRTLQTIFYRFKN